MVYTLYGRTINDEHGMEIIVRIVILILERAAGAKNGVFGCFLGIFLFWGMSPCRTPPGWGGWVSDLK